MPSCRKRSAQLSVCVVQVFLQSFRGTTFAIVNVHPKCPTVEGERSRTRQHQRQSQTPRTLHFLVLPSSYYYLDSGCPPLCPWTCPSKAVGQPQAGGTSSIQAVTPGQFLKKQVRVSIQARPHGANQTKPSLCQVPRPF